MDKSGGGKSCNQVCADEPFFGSLLAAPQRDAQVKSPALVNYLFNQLNGGAECASSYPANGGAAPYVVGSGSTKKCYYNVGDPNPGASGVKAENMCCCVEEYSDPTRNCQLPCEIMGQTEKQCDLEGACVWIQGWRTERNAKIASLQQKIKASKANKRRKRKLKRRLGWTWRQYAGCSGNAGCQYEWRCYNYCRPICESNAAPNCEWRSNGEGCQPIPTQAPTTGPTIGS